MSETPDERQLDLPDDLRSLDRELASIQYEERPSFAPELRAELGRTWAEGPPPRRSPWIRHLAAAGLAALLIGGMSVPSARASFARLLGVMNVEVVEQVEAPTAPTTAPPMEKEAEAAPAAEVPVVRTAALEPVAEEPLPSVVARRDVLVPEMLERDRAEELLRGAYPTHLQNRGVGGTVWLRLWVDEFGSAGLTNVARTSGIGELDRAALHVAPGLRFEPAVQNGEPVGTWIEFPVLFEPDSTLVRRSLTPAVDPLSLPTVPRGELWQLRDPIDLTALPPVATDARSVTAAGHSLERALVDPTLVERYGPVGAILSGEAPDGIGPTQWRAAVGDALQDAIEQGTDTPAAMLAYGRIRLRQGLRTEARSLFERGLRMALRDETVSTPWVVAELHHERGTLLRERWLAHEGVGRVRAEVFGNVQCAQARSTGGVATGYASSARLIAWNYLCPGELGRVFEDGFEPVGTGTVGDLSLMMASFRAATEADPGHVPSNTDLLVTIASAQRWDDVLVGARRFAHTSGGHPNALLLTGLALHRLERSAEAVSHFEAALGRMPLETSDEIRDVGALLDPNERARYRRLPVDARRAWEADYWAARDRSPSTDVNERRVEHLARSAYAFLRFGGVFGDAGEVWVRFGGPNSIHIVDEGSGRLTEFWDYGSGPDITFVRWGSAKRTDLTPEGRAYVDDLGKIFPPQ